MSNTRNSCEVISITPFFVSCVSTPASTPNTPDGTASLFPQGGTPPYQYVWDHGPVTSSITGLLPGTYFCTVSDLNSQNVRFVECVVGVETQVHSFELCLSDNDQNSLIVLKEVNFPDTIVFFEIGGSEIYNTPSVGDVVSIDSMGSAVQQAGLRNCCYERISYNPNDPGNFIGIFGSNQSTKIVFSSPTACSSTIVQKKIFPENISLFSEDKSKNREGENVTKSKSNYKVLKIDKTNFIEIRDSKPDSFKTVLPDLSKNSQQEYSLEKFQAFPSNLNVRVSDGNTKTDQIIQPRIVCYKMKSGKDDRGTMIFNGEQVTVNLRSEGKQLALKKIKGSDDYAIFDTNDLKEDLGDLNSVIIDLGTTNTKNLISIQKNKNESQTCTSIALDVDSEVYRRYNESIQDTTDFVLSRHAIASSIFDEQTGGLRKLQVSYVNIWTVDPPYQWDPNLSGGQQANLTGFRSYWNSEMSDIPRNLAQHITLEDQDSLAGAFSTAFSTNCNESCTFSAGYSAVRLSRIDIDQDFSIHETRDLRRICSSLGTNFCSPRTNSCQKGEWGVNPLTKNNWVLDTCGSPTQSDRCDIYPEGESGIMSFCSNDNLVFHPKVISDYLIPNVSLSPDCLTNCFDNSTTSQPPPNQSNGGSSSCESAPIYNIIPQTLKAIISNENILNLQKVYEFSTLVGKYKYLGTTSNSGQIENLTVIQEFDSCEDVIPPPPPPPPSFILCLSDQVENQYEFQPGLYDLNGNATWYNNEFNVTLTNNSTIPRWEINPWTNIGTGEMVQYTSQDVPQGSWNNVGFSSEINWIMTIGECAGIPLNVSANSEPVSCVGLSDGSVNLIGSGGAPPYTFTIVGVSPPWPDFVPQAYYDNLIAGNYTAQVKDSEGSVASTNFTIGNGSNTNLYTISVNQQITSQSETSTSISKSGTYNINLTPSLLQNTSVSFKLEVTLVFSYDNTGSVAYSSNLTTLKNGYPLFLNTTEPVSSSESYCDGENIKYTESFKYVSETIYYSSSDSIYGQFDYDVVFNAISTNCQCPTLGSLTFTFDIIDLSIDGGDCETVQRSDNQASSSVSGTRCEVLPTPTPTVTQTMTATPAGTPPATPNRTPDITPTNTRTPSPTPIPRPKAGCLPDVIYNFNENGLNKILLFDINIGNTLGQYGIIYDVISNAKRFQIIYDDQIVADSLFVGDPGGVTPGLTNYTIWDDYDINGENVTYNYFGEPFGGEFVTITDSIIDTSSTTGMLTFDKTNLNSDFMTIKIFSSNIRTDFSFLIDPICNDLPGTPTPTPTVTVTNTLTYTPTHTPTATIAIEPIECGEPLGTVLAPGNGIFDMDFSIGNQQTGFVEATFDALGVPERFQIRYGGQVVADSLFVGDPDYSPSAWQNAVDLIESTDTLTLYTFNENDCSSISGGYYIGCFSAQGTVAVDYTSSDIAPDIAGGRLNGDQGNQIGVVPGFPVEDSDGNIPNSAWGRVKLRFYRDNLLYDKITLRTISIPGTATSSFIINDIVCPYQDTNIYFTTKLGCNFETNIIPGNTVFRIQESEGWQVDQYFVLNHPAYPNSTGVYRIDSIVSATEVYVELNTDNSNGPYSSAQDALDYSYNTFGKGCGATFVSCCDGGDNGGALNGQTVNFTVNLPVLDFALTYYSNTGDVWDYFGVDYINMNYCIVKTVFDPSVPTNAELETIFIENGSSDENGCTSGRCQRCVKRIRICNSTDVLDLIINTNASHDYSVGSCFLISDSAFTDEGYSSNCYEIVDLSTELTITSSFSGFYFDHTPISGCEFCLT